MSVGCIATMSGWPRDAVKPSRPAVRVFGNHTPEIPTMAEAGGGDFVTTYWFGLLAPARTPPALVKRINREAVDVLQSAGMKSALLEQGTEPGAGTPEEFGAFIRNETVRFKKVIELAGI